MRCRPDVGSADQRNEFRHPWHRGRCFRFDAGVGDADIGAFHKEQMPDLTLIQMPVSLRLDVIESFLSRGGAG